MAEQTGGPEESIEELRHDLDELEIEIEQVRREVDAEVPQGPTFAEGEGDEPA
jgi:hypothetical protein